MSFVSCLCLCLSEVSAQELPSLIEQIDQIERDLNELPAKAEAAESKIDIGEKAVTITATDVDNARDTLLEVRFQHPTKQIRICVAPMPKPNGAALLQGKKVARPISLSTDLVEGFRESMQELGDCYPELAAIRKDPSNLHGNLALVEKALHLDTISPGATLTERCYRVAWVERLSRVADENVTVTFIVRK